MQEGFVCSCRLFGVEWMIQFIIVCTGSPTYVLGNLPKTLKPKQLRDLKSLVPAGPRFVCVCKLAAILRMDVPLLSQHFICHSIKIFGEFGN